MIPMEELQKLVKTTPSKIVMLVMDGLGGIEHPDIGQTELEAAQTPNLDNLAKDSICGLSHPISPGITPGSGPAHLALFGYDPIKTTIGRGVLESLGIDFDLHKSDVAARANFCTIDENGLITDRRAGRIPTDQSSKLCEMLGQIEMDGAELHVVPVSEHRFVVVLRGEGLSADLEDTDPQSEGLAPLEVKATSQKAAKTAALFNQFANKAKLLLAGSHPANMMLLRGFSQMPDIPGFSELYKLKSAAIACYPMYLGLSKVVGMQTIKCANVQQEFDTLASVYNDYDFFYVHIKKTDSHGEDGAFGTKVEEIEKIDSLLPQLTALDPDVIVVTGDHSTPAQLKGHSWHPIPLMIYSKWCRKDTVHEFSESSCASGALGNLPAVDIMPLAMANALKLNKYGA
ncbi:MAG: 2,3-bisphosphoglycerate-independent phosphoglycerate mutase [Chloroflexi bacterium]|jgi:2,3-bisphosphoglycerate-independent phosphoglycerate mutase|nr:2,3-bisphosphoglycerate-independent phosphoglycerate mutase [Chloroflexota bacterium]MBT7082359.1 2,3-bisphosphoglycerate-independent phosphoglycerate mutase [Chloroflexota bacterium]MBT7289190.1 2,3-bisphosphoglycerate-independent phosphoglycerate mutase [Chloroflexota bacterium]